MPSYDASSFDPPAPVARVTLRHTNGGSAASDALLLIDTGADVTILPRRSVDPLGIPPAGNAAYELVGFGGGRTFAHAVVLDMIFLNRAFRGRYLITDQMVGILGRDVLNHVTLLLDGPQQRWSQPPA